MKKICLICSLLFSSGLSIAQQFVWLNELKTNAVIQQIKLNPQGNIMVAGIFSDTIDLNPNFGSAYFFSGGTIDAFLASYTTAGELIWAKQISGVDNQQIIGFPFNSNDELIYYGFFSGNTDLNPDSGIDSYTSVGAYDLFISKLDAGLNYVNSVVLPLPGGPSLFATNFEVDPFDNIYLSGAFNGTINFDPVGTTGVLSSNGADADIFLAKYDENGNLIWLEQFGSSGYDVPLKMVLSHNQKIVLCGQITDTVSLNYSATTPAIGVPLNTSMFLACYDLNGNHLWSESFGINTLPYALETDNNNNILVSGLFNYTQDFDASGNVAQMTAISESDIFLAKYDENGTYIFSESFGGPRTETSYDMATDQFNNIYLCGFSEDSLNLDSSAGSVLYCINSDHFVAKFDASGNFLWSKEGETVQSNVNTIMVDPTGTALYFAGIYRNHVHFDDINGTGMDYYTDFGSLDGMIGKIEFPATEIIEVSNPELFVIFPNPSSGECTIQLNEQGLGTDNYLEFYNAFGKLIFVTHIVSSNTTLQFSDLSSGIYFIRLLNEKNSLATKKVIIQH